MARAERGLGSTENFFGGFGVAWDTFKLLFKARSTNDSTIVSFSTFILRFWFLFMLSSIGMVNAALYKCTNYLGSK